MLPRNLIVIPHAGFTMAKAWKSQSPFSFMSRSRAGELLEAKHHSTGF
jgi:hypothetical protein